MLLHAHDRLEAALVCYRRAQLLRPDDYRWPYLSGVVHASQSRNDDAARSFRAALSLNPGDVPSQLRLADALLAANDYSGSRASYEAVMKLRPSQAHGYYGAARTWAAEGDGPRAAELYQKACELYPDYAAAHYALGLLYRQLGRTADAQAHLAAYERNKTASPPREDPLMASVQSQSGGVLPLLARAKTADAAGRLDEAVKLHQQALELDPRQEQTHINLISLYGRMKLYDRAQAHYRSAVALNPNRDEAHYNYAVLLTVLRRLPEAVAAYKRALELNPTNAEAHNNLAYLLAQQRRYDEALQHALKAVESKPGYPQAHYNAGVIYMQRGQSEHAIRHLEAAIQPNEPHASRYMHSLAAVYARTGNAARARELEQRARDLARAGR
jgi:tetratricopeptide (TPR) repeat protein